MLQPRTTARTPEKVAKDYKRKYYHNPIRWVSEIADGFLWSKQKEIIESIFNNKYTTVRSCHSSGKTYVAAMAILCFLYTRTPCKIITSAPTLYQVSDLLWSNIRHIFRSKLGPKGFPGDLLTLKLRVRDDWFAIGISPRETVNFQGFHQKNILVVFDESPGVRAEIVNGAESLMSSGDAHMLHIGNPDISSGHFFDSFSDPDYKQIHIGCHDTPNYTGELVPRSMAKELIQPFPASSDVSFL